MRGVKARISSVGAIVSQSGGIASVTNSSTGTYDIVRDPDIGPSWDPEETVVFLTSEISNSLHVLEYTIAADGESLTVRNRIGVATFADVGFSLMILPSQGD